MFESETVFVIGAGASHEVGLPIGSGLKKQIAEKIDIRFEDGWTQSSGDRQIMNVIKEHSRSPQSLNTDPNAYLHCAWQIRDAMPQAISIDNYLDAHRGNKLIEFCAKLGIVKSILEAERESTLYVDYKRAERLDLSRLSDTWYNGFFQLLSERVALGEIDHIFDNVTFISFNYDRCIEQYLYFALQNYYSLSPEKTKELMAKVRILRPYGSIGPLPLQVPQSVGVAFGLPNSNGIPYGSESGNILDMATQIKTFTEQVEDRVALNAIKSAIQQAETLVLLGFGFHPQNLELIAPKLPSMTERVFATAKGISKSDCAVVAAELSNMLQNPNLEHDLQIELRSDLTCSQLFSEYWRSIASAF
jgi:hypothetical protein